MANTFGGTASFYNAANMTYHTYSVLSNELNTPKVVVCPADERTARTNFTTTGFMADFVNNLAISYFVGRDADETQPQMFLAGDRNIGNGPAAPQQYGFSPSSPSGAGALVSLGTNPPPALQWTDRMHQKNGNIVLADGSVQQLTSAKLRELCQQTGDRSPPAGTIVSPGGNVLLIP
ncbi:MAG: hypothetical protein BWX84_01250 [Verrucomicrobia bacterium ADurb.Bin118]|nr:MAG: hypothetical protein BWX84_01250 [Verrucomicrobia bacterium ADurb.Bin118]